MCIHSSNVAFVLTILLFRTFSVHKENIQVDTQVQDNINVRIISRYLEFENLSLNGFTKIIMRKS